MVVTTNLHNGIGIVRGDAFPIRRSYPNVPTSTYVTAGYLTLKSAIADADPGLFQLTATIEDSGSVTGIAVLRWDVSAANTLAMVQDTPYYFDTQINLSDGQKLTPEQGVTSAVFQVTTL